MAMYDHPGPNEKIEHMARERKHQANHGVGGQVEEVDSDGGRCLRRLADLFLLS